MMVTEAPEDEGCEEKGYGQAFFLRVNFFSGKEAREKWTGTGSEGRGTE